MPQQSSVHPFLSWTKQRVDEMDATLASIESKMSQVKADAKAKADDLLADLRKRRDEFGAKFKEHAETGGVAAETAKAQFESQWNDFEKQVNNYFDTVGKQMEQRQATFQEAAAAQAKAWRDAADKLRNEATKLAAARRGDVDAAIQQLNADAADAEARLQKLKQTGADSWTTLSAALAESRKAFERANQQGWEALRRAISS